jgi:hypothetical protein
MTTTLFHSPATDPTQVPPALPCPVPGTPARHSVLFVMPFYPKDTRGSLGKHVLTPSLTFPALAAVTSPSWSMRYWDENLLQGPPPLDPNPHVVAITVHLTFARRAYQLARWFRGHGCTVVMGGLHAQSCPEEVAPHCDALAIGNGVALWPAILADIEAGRLRPRYEAPFENFADEPTPDRSIIPRASFLTTASLIATRGCHNRCDFCYLATGKQRTRYQMRPPAEVAAELAALDEPYGVFVDNNLGANRPYLRRLCHAQRVFSLQSIWARRPQHASAVLPYLASSLLYKKDNPLWRLLIRHRLTHAAWKPLVAVSAWSKTLSHGRAAAQSPLPSVDGPPAQRAGEGLTRLEAV